jgi:ATP-dependent DNA helicase RecG
MGHSLIEPTSFMPFPKNPVIARVFIEIGRADELGSGVKNRGSIVIVPLIWQ